MVRGAGAARRGGEPSRGALGKLSIASEPGRDRLADATRDAEPVARAAGVTIALDAAPAATHVIGDLRRLRQVLDNLRDNAIRRTGEMPALR